jgi:diguanylate cyclase (GGDEF)-like protein
MAATALSFPHPEQARLLEETHNSSSFLPGEEKTFSADYETVADLLSCVQQAQGALARLQEVVPWLVTQACTDILTGVESRGSILARAEQELARAIREGSSLTFVFADVDGLKSVNDHFGHQAGDLALATVAWHLRQGLRSYDAVGRYGGDEFLLVLHCDAASAQELVERMRAAIAAAPTIAPHGPLTVTTTFGVATYPGTGEVTVQALLQEADRALCTGKTHGRNRVVLAS